MVKTRKGAKEAASASPTQAPATAASGGPKQPATKANASAKPASSSPNQPATKTKTASKSAKSAKAGKTGSTMALAVPESPDERFSVASPGEFNNGPLMAAFKKAASKLDLESDSTTAASASSRASTSSSSSPGTPASTIKLELVQSKVDQVRQASFVPKRIKQEVVAETQAATPQAEAAKAAPPQQLAPSEEATEGAEAATAAAQATEATEGAEAAAAAAQAAKATEGAEAAAPGQAAAPETIGPEAADGASRSSRGKKGAAAIAMRAGESEMTEEDRDAFEKEREAALNNIPQNGQEWNTHWNAWKRAMTAKRKPPPDDIAEQFAAAMKGGGDLKEKYRLFKSFFIAGGNFVRMKLIMNIKFEKVVKTKETERGFTKSQLADHYKMAEDSRFITELIAALKAQGKFRLHHLLPHLEEGITYFDIESVKRITETSLSINVEAKGIMDPNTEEGAKFLDICSGAGLFDEPTLPGMGASVHLRGPNLAMTPSGGGDDAPPVEEAGQAKETEAERKEREKNERKEKKEQKMKETAERLKKMTGPERAREFQKGVLSDITRCDKLVLQLKFDKASTYLITQLEGGLKLLRDKYLDLNTKLENRTTPEAALRQAMVAINADLKLIKPTYERLTGMLATSKHSFASFQGDGSKSIYESI